MTKSLLFGAALALAAHGVFAAAPDPQPKMLAAGCMACHTKSSKLVGPAFKLIAAKYKGQAVIPQLMAKVRAGGKGNWGTQLEMTPMGPDKIKDADLKAAIEFILKQG
jgi:cytochrome c